MFCVEPAIKTIDMHGILIDPLGIKWNKSRLHEAHRSSDIACVTKNPSHTNMKKTLIVFLLALNATLVSSRAAILVTGYWEMGDADPGATAGAALIGGETVDSVSGGINLLSGGSDSASVYSATVPPAANNPANSTLSVFLSGTPDPGKSYPPFLRQLNPTTYNYTDNFGLEMWVRPGSTSDAVLAYNGALSSDPGWGLLISSGNYIALFGGVAVLSGPAVTINQWTELALVVSGGATSLYVNGAQVATGSGLHPTTGAAGQLLTIGATATSGSALNGYVDDVRMFTFTPGNFSASDLNYAVPEPSTWFLLGTASFMLFGMRILLRRKRCA